MIIGMIVGSIISIVSAFGSMVPIVAPGFGIMFGMFVKK